MKSYSITFYKKGVVQAMYYRQFENKPQLIDWCLSVGNDMGYTDWEINEISEAEFLANIDEEMSTKH